MVSSAQASESVVDKPASKADTHVEADAIHTNPASIDASRDAVLEKKNTLPDHSQHKGAKEVIEALNRKGNDAAMATKDHYPDVAKAAAEVTNDVNKSEKSNLKPAPVIMVEGKAMKYNSAHDVMLVGKENVANTPPKELKAQLAHEVGHQHQHARGSNAGAQKIDDIYDAVDKNCGPVEGEKVEAFVRSGVKGGSTASVLQSFGDTVEKSKENLEKNNVSQPCRDAAVDVMENAAKKSQASEMDADRIAARAGHGAELSKSLDSTGGKGGELNSHPSADQRKEALKQLAKESGACEAFKKCSGGKDVSSSAPPSSVGAEKGPSQPKAR